uniref:RING-type domain-containing protein n=1 Tax=Rhabditophanes sp. KR3021 TaxID=114890 RepID=A0AC35THL3_9BILA
MVDSLTCRLCKNYLIDCVTTTSCLHSFCRSCLFKHIAKEATCPGCPGKTILPNLSTALRRDNKLQKIVYVVSPESYWREMEARGEFCQKRLLTQSDIKLIVDNDMVAFSDQIVQPEDLIAFQLEYVSSLDQLRQVASKECANIPKKIKATIPKSPQVDGDIELPQLKMYLRTKAMNTISVLQEIIEKKFELQDKYEVVFSLKAHPFILSGQVTFTDLVYMSFWDREKPLPICFTILRKSVESVVSKGVRKDVSAAVDMPQLEKMEVGEDDGCDMPVLDKPVAGKDHPTLPKMLSPPNKGSKKEFIATIGGQKRTVDRSDHHSNSSSPPVLINEGMAVNGKQNDPKNLNLTPISMSSNSYGSLNGQMISLPPGTMPKLGQHQVNKNNLKPMINGQTMNGQNVNGQTMNGQNVNGQNIIGQNMNGMMGPNQQQHRPPQSYYSPQFIQTSNGHISVPNNGNYQIMTLPQGGIITQVPHSGMYGMTSIEPPSKKSRPSLDGQQARYVFPVNGPQFVQFQGNPMTAQQFIHQHQQHNNLNQSMLLQRQITQQNQYKAIPTMPTLAPKIASGPRSK